MNDLERKLAGVEGAVRRHVTGRVSVKRVRWATVIEDGEELFELVRDDIGMGDAAVLIVDGEFTGTHTPRVMLPFSLNLLKDYSPRKVGEMLWPNVERHLAKLQETFGREEKGT